MDAATKQSLSRRQSKSFVQDTVVRIMEYENELVDNMRQLVTTLDDEEKLTGRMERLDALVGNETTINTFVGLGGLSLLVHTLAVHCRSNSLNPITCKVLTKIMTTKPETIQQVFELEGPEAILDTIEAAAGEGRYCADSFRALVCLVQETKTHEVLLERNFQQQAVQILRKQDNTEVLVATANAMSAIMMVSPSLRAQTTPQSFAAIADNLKSLLASAGTRSDLWPEQAAAFLGLVGNSCVDNGTGKNEVAELGLLSVILGFLEVSEPHEDVLESGCIALAKCTSNHETNTKAVLKHNNALRTLSSTVRKHRDNQFLTEACVDVLLSVSSLNSTTFECQYATELYDAGTVELVMELLQEQRGNVQKSARYIGRVGLKSNLKDGMVQSGVLQLLVNTLRNRPMDPEDVNASLQALGNVISGSNPSKQKAGETGVYDVIVLLLEEIHREGLTCHDSVVLNALQLLANLSDGCQSNQSKASDKKVIMSVLHSMEKRIEDWKVQEHGCNFLVKVVGSDESLTSLMLSAQADILAEKVLSTHAGNMMVESGARTFVDQLSRGRRGRYLNHTHGPTVRRLSRTREKANDALTRGSSRGPARDKSMSPVRERMARRRGTSVEPSTNRRHRFTSKALTLETVQEQE